MKGAILAGGAGKRLGHVSKATVELEGRPLALHVAETLAEVCDNVAIVCKPDTELPDLPGVERWDEPAEPRHPLVGIVHALEQAGGPVLVCAVDMPWVTTDACRSLVEAAPGGLAAVAVGDGMPCPVFGVYAPAALEAMREAGESEPLRDIVERLNPARVALPPALLRSVNSPADLVSAAPHQHEGDAGEERDLAERGRRAQVRGAQQGCERGHGDEHAEQRGGLKDEPPH